MADVVRKLKEKRHIRNHSVSDDLSEQHLKNKYRPLLEVYQARWDPALSQIDLPLVEDQNSYLLSMVDVFSSSLSTLD